MLSAQETVTNTYRALTEAFFKGDAATIAGMYTDDAEFFLPGMPVVTGRDAIYELWKTIVGPGGSTVKIDIREVRESGDLAYDTGFFTASASDGSTLNAGKWIVIWRRESGNAWKIHRDFMHWDIPHAATT
jgi:uncharacterized protein (TIGR02246 family)